jgi:hypothetical protein
MVVGGWNVTRSLSALRLRSAGDRIRYILSIVSSIRVNERDLTPSSSTSMAASETSSREARKICWYLFVVQRSYQNSLPC